MTAAIYNAICEQGATFSFPLALTDSTGNPLNLTGYSAEMQVRTTVGIPNNDTCPNLVLSMSSGAGSIVLGGTAGTVVATAPASITSTLPIGQFYYDLVLTASGGEPKNRVIQGLFTVSGGVSK